VGVGTIAYVVVSGFCLLKLWRSRLDENFPPGATNSSESHSSAFESRPSALDRLLWLLLPAWRLGVAAGNHEQTLQDVAVVPFLWVLPLALYLLTFIICFDSPHWYVRTPFALALVVALTGLCWVLFQGTDASLRMQIGIYSAGLFVCCMVCHGELYRLRPDPRLLTGFYLMIAAGGALGGLFVAVGAPLLFTITTKCTGAFCFCGLLFIVVCVREKSSAGSREWRWLACALTLTVLPDWTRDWRIWSGGPAVLSKGASIGLRVGMWVLLALIVTSWIVRKKFQTFPYWRLLTCVWLVPGWLVLAAALWLQVSQSDDNVVSRSRNFYGTLKVSENRKNEPDGHYFLLQHGRITHGLQFVDPVRATWATTYYAEGSGIELAVRALPSAGRRIGVVGLGYWHHDGFRPGRGLPARLRDQPRSATARHVPFHLPGQFHSAGRACAG